MNPVSRRFVLILVSCVYAFAVSTGASAAPSPPDIILCMADDLGWGDTGYNGHKVLKTPNLDAMCRAGLRFDRFYAAAPVCSPTRGSALTGRHPHRYGVFFANVGHLPQQEVTIAEAARIAGYRCGFFGKWHLGTLSKTDPSRNRGKGKSLVQHFAPPWEHGFHDAFATESKVPTWDPLVAGGKRGTWWDPLPDPTQGKPYGTPYYHNGRRVEDDLRGDDSRIIMDRAVAFIRAEAKKPSPFLAVIWFHAPHLPVVAGKKYTAPYANEDKYTQHYYGCIAAMDEQLGRLRRELRQLGVADNTMLWFCSDNGPEGNSKAPGSASPLRGRKRSLFEGGVRVPGILEWPAKFKPGRTTGIPVCTVDYYPTVIDVLRLQGKVPRQPQPLDGISLLPLIEGRMAARPRPLYFESRGTAAIMDNQYKLFVQVSRTPPGAKRKAKDKLSKAMLFDLAADPQEQNDLAAGQAERVAEMRARLMAWRESCRKSLAGEDYQAANGR